LSAASATLKLTISRLALQLPSPVGTPELEGGVKTGPFSTAEPDASAAWSASNAAMAEAKALELGRISGPKVGVKSAAPPLSSVTPWLGATPAWSGRRATVDAP
jgi:hypothetical protein